MSGLFQTVADQDRLSFYAGSRLQPKAVMDFLDLEKSDVAKLAGISKQSVRFDDAMPKAMFDRIEEVANVCNLVARVFEGNVNKTALWFRTRNPMLGDISPRDMLRFGRYDKLRRFVVGALADRAADSAATVTKSRSGRARPRAASE